MKAKSLVGNVDVIEELMAEGSWDRRSRGSRLTG
jgi:hypothetical protein